MKIKEIKRVLSLVLSLLMALNLLPLSAFAGSYTEETNSFEVDYNIVAAWGESSQHISITLTNTGIEPIVDWRLYYDINGDIESIWAASLETDENGIQYINNAGYNSVIMPDSSTVFGYLMSNVTI